MRRAFALLGVTSLAACAGLLGLAHSRPGWFSHDTHGRAGVQCSTCHTDIARTSSAADEIASVALPGPATCVTCHDPPHDTRPCGDCHGGKDTARRAEMARYYLRFSHQEHLPRARGNCARCHDAREPGARLSPPMASCLACHPHDQQFGDRDCDQCHTHLDEEAPRPKSHVVHDLGFVDRHGPAAMAGADLCASCHRETFCASCHGVRPPALPATLQFERVSLDGLHRAGFASRHADVARTDPGSCLSCHSPAGCARCHASEGVASDARRLASPHPPGWVGTQGNLHGSAARRDPLACASCHQGPGEQLCVDCHRVGGVGGSPHPMGYQSRRALTEAPCRQCHGGL